MEDDPNVHILACAIQQRAAGSTELQILEKLDGVRRLSCRFSSLPSASFSDFQILLSSTATI